MKKFEQFINEIYKSSMLSQTDIEIMLEYLENFADANGYDIYRPKPMDISPLIPDFKEKRITKDDPYGEEEWEIEKPKLMSSTIMIFEDSSDKAKKILTFTWVTDGKICTNELYISNSNFENIDFKLLKQIIEM